LNGINALADVVEVTLGPAGRNVIIEHPSNLAPIITKDGVTVADTLKLGDGGRQAGLDILRHSAKTVSNKVGDGTTTTIVIARAMAKAYCMGLDTGLDFQDMIKGGEDTLHSVLESLKEIKKPGLNKKEMANIGTVSANGDASVGELLAEAFETLGPEGTIRVQMGSSVDDELDIIDGACWEQGFMSPAFVTDKSRECSELINPLIFLYDRPLEQTDLIVAVMEIAQNEGRPLLVIADEVSEDILTIMTMNHLRGKLKCVAITPPGFGEGRKECLEDLAILTGGKTLMEIRGESLPSLTREHLGSAERVIVTEGETKLIGPEGNTELREERIKSLTFRLENVDTESRSPTSCFAIRESIEDRLTILSARYAELNVGAATDPEIRYRMQLFNNARNAIKVALKDGVLPGGGWALHHSCNQLDLEGSSDESPSYQYGKISLINAIRTPLQLIIHNAGYKPEKIELEVDQLNDSWIGFDAKNNSVTNLLEAGVIDPYALIKTQLETAFSIIKMLTQSDGMIVRESTNKLPDIGFDPAEVRSTMEVDE